MNFFFKQHPISEQKHHPLHLHHHLHHVLSNVQTHFTNFIRIPINPMPFFSNDSISDHIDKLYLKKIRSSPSSVMKERLKDVPVYRLKKDDQLRYQVASSDVANRNANLYFFNKADAQDLADDCNTVEVNTRDGLLQVVKVPLAELIRVEELGGVTRPLSPFCCWFVGDFLPAFAPDKVYKFVRRKVSDPNVYLRLVPDMSEVRNALQERKKAGLHSDTFSGVPVFQSDALKSRVDGSSDDNPSPAFFRKADLEKALCNKKQKNHDVDTHSEIIQVTALEDIIQEMKDCSKSKLNNVMLVPPGGEL